MSHVVIIGGGIAGLEASRRLTDLGIEVSLIERSDQLGGKLNQWDTLFPDNQSASDLLNLLNLRLSSSIDKRTNTTVDLIQPIGNLFDVKLSTGEKLQTNAILLTTGFDAFDAHKKEEYGYGIYDNVITSVDLENIFRNGKPLLTKQGKIPSRICMIHCVGSRDEKVGNSYCSQVCCITAIKQAIKIKQINPDTEVFSFYMDLRMWGRKHEILYKEAQINYGIQFIRGRLSECFENPDGSVQIKAEDTLMGNQITMASDIVVLMSGMVPSKDSTLLQDCLHLKVDDDRFFQPIDSQIGTCQGIVPGVFFAGACTGPKTIANTLHEANTAAFKISEYLNQGKN